MVLVGENIHIISKLVGESIGNRDSAFIQELAKAQAAAGADYLDINMGPARTNADETAKWLVDTVQSVIELPLSIDTMNPVAMENGLKFCRKRPLLNSCSGKTDSKEKMFPLAKKYNTDVVISVLTNKGCPPDVDSRAESIIETVAFANKLGIPNEDIWVDPIVLPVSADQKQVIEAMEFMDILPHLLPGVKSLVGLSNVSNGTPDHLRGILNRSYMVMLGRKGLYSAIVDVLDAELVAINQGQMPRIVDLISKTMEGEDISLDSLSRQEQDYVKTTRVLMGQTLYSHAWLEL
jgi:5-methyltetrahydrofolate corrinoid/iron sulfur protein methyltransferase